MPGKTAIFIESTLSHIDARKAYPDGDFYKSIKKGDLLKIISKGYSTIVIVDGGFDWTPSIWHKEIMIAIKMGVVVIGASSMGALRAAELRDEGMLGFGCVYKAYLDDPMKSDDEVAISFDRITGESTLALINLKQSVGRCINVENNKVITKLENIHFTERTWGAIKNKLDENEYTQVKENYIDIKRKDSETLLHKLAQGSLKLASNKSAKTELTIFEKKLIVDVMNIELVLLVDNNEPPSAYDVHLLYRAKSLVKLIGVPKTKENILKLYHTLEKSFALNISYKEKELMRKISLYREKKGLISGKDFKDWLHKRYLLNSNLIQVFQDYFTIEQHLYLDIDFHTILSKLTTPK